MRLMGYQLALFLILRYAEANNPRQVADIVPAARAIDSGQGEVPGGFRKYTGRLSMEDRGVRRRACPFLDRRVPGQDRRAGQDRHRRTARQGCRGRRRAGRPARADRLVLGTDFPYETGAVFERAVSYITTSGLAAAEADRVLSVNAEALFSRLDP